MTSIIPEEKSWLGDGMLGEVWLCTRIVENQA